MPLDPPGLIGSVEIVSDTKPSARSCFKIESSSEFKGAEVSTLKQYSNVSLLPKKRWSILLLLS